MFMNIYNQSHNDPSFIKAWQRFTKIKWDTFEDFDKLRNPVTPEDALDSEAVGRVGMFYEGLGCFVKEDYIPIRLVALLMTGMTRHFWEKYIPIIDEARERRGFPRFMSEAEYLYNELMRYTEEHPELAT
jgi:hypothetical protein